MKRETTIIFSSLALLTVLGFYLPGIAGADGFLGSVLNRQVIQMDNGDKICLIPDLESICPIAVNCDTNVPLNSADISLVLKATRLGSPPAAMTTRSVVPSQVPIGYAGVPEQACPKIFLRASPDMGASWVCIGGQCYYLR